MMTDDVDDISIDNVMDELLSLILDFMIELDTPINNYQKNYDYGQPCWYAEQFVVLHGVVWRNSRFNLGARHY